MVLNKLLILLILLTNLGNCFGQTYGGIKYQGVARDNSGNILSNQLVNLRLTIIDNTPTGTQLYQETHSVTSNQFGLLNLVIGSGAIVQGVYANINWGNTDKFLKIEMDISGGTNFVSIGTSQFLSVPYALYAVDINENIKKEIRRNKTFQYLNH